ncbi:MAG TPA: sigma-54 dependent transcriptional regulator [Pirellulales bacterium]|jgi:DNA-binding NtrC family response regulator
MGLTKLVGQSAWMRALRERIDRVAAYSSNVLIIGPSGTGKELIARAIHGQSPRSGAPFIPVDCTALSGELFASHLFGHIKGAFTGADYERLGCFRAAERGTILLDEIGELAPDLQSKLLRAIQERVVIPVGSERPVPIDVRIIAATNRDLADEVREGRFRLDLFYRLNVVSFETLALSRRTEEIESLASHFLDTIACEQGVPRKRFSPAAIAALKSHPWPGNVRELQNVVERAVIFASSDLINAEAIPFDRRQSQMPVPTESGPEPRANAHEAPWSTMAEVEREHIRVTLAHTFYNQSAAAALLDMDRTSLARKIIYYGISIPAPRRGRPRKIQP